LSPSRRLEDSGPPSTRQRAIKGGWGDPPRFLEEPGSIFGRDLGIGMALPRHVPSAHRAVVSAGNAECERVMWGRKGRDLSCRSALARILHPRIAMHQERHMYRVQVRWLEVGSLPRPKIERRYLGSGQHGNITNPSDPMSATEMSGLLGRSFSAALRASCSVPLQRRLRNDRCRGVLVDHLDLCG
jgi:hypothetical protein